MQTLGELWRRLRFFFRRDKFQRELQEELLHHEELSTQAHREEGLLSDDARYTARRELGNALVLREESQDM